MRKLEEEEEEDEATQKRAQAAAKKTSGSSTDNFNASRHEDLGHGRRPLTV